MLSSAARYSSTPARIAVARLRSIPEERGNYRYAEGKWSVKELIGHLLDDVGIECSGC